MQELLNVMRLQGNMQLNMLATIRLGTVTDYDPTTASVTVNLMPDDTGKSLTGEIPVATCYIGQNAAPRIGDQAIVCFQEGNINLGIVLGFLYNDEDTPPSAPSGEWWLVHSNGSLIKMKNNGELDINGKVTLALSGQSVTITAQQNVTASAQNITATASDTLTLNSQTLDVVTQTASLNVSGEVVGSATKWTLTGNLAVVGNITATGTITPNTGP